MKESKVKRILCYGDSNTWGYMPGSGQRFDSDTRWTGVLQELLGEEYCIIEAGLNGRTTVFDSPFDDYLNGKAGLGYAFLQASPVDLVAIMLGTNDLKYTNAAGAARGVGALVSEIRSITNKVSSSFYLTNALQPEKADTKILIISPILVHPDILRISPMTVFEEEKRYEKAQGFSAAYKNVAAQAGAWFLDAAAFAQPSDTDGIHMTAEGHKALGHAVAAKVSEIFAEEQ